MACKCKPEEKPNTAGNEAAQECVNSFDHGVVVGSSRDGLRVADTAGILGFSHTTASGVYTEWSEIPRLARKPADQCWGWEYTRGRVWKCGSDVSPSRPHVRAP